VPYRSAAPSHHQLPKPRHRHLAGWDLLLGHPRFRLAKVEHQLLTAEDALAVYGTNVVSVVRMISAFVPILRASSAPTIVNVTSGMGSFALVHDPERIESKIDAPLYTSSKSAVTMLTVQYAKAFPEMRINAADPGDTATDFNGNKRHADRAERTDAIVELATRGGGALPTRSSTAPASLLLAFQLTDPVRFATESARSRRDVAHSHQRVSRSRDVRAAMTAGGETRGDRHVPAPRPRRRARIRPVRFRTVRAGLRAPHRFFSG
jgi:NAD(P)-dependent dehydrogenase (short-subunit alcohol dehydrogenase family)